MISENHVLQADFGRKRACKEIPGKKYPALKKISLMTYNAEKMLHHYISGEKISNFREIWGKILKLNR